MAHLFSRPYGTWSVYWDRYPAMNRWATIRCPAGANTVRCIRRQSNMITISKETTYLTEPLRSDGWIDFAAVLNQPRMMGVTAENNAAVPFWQAIGPQPIAREGRTEFFVITRNRGIAC